MHNKVYLFFATLAWLLLVCFSLDCTAKAYDIQYISNRDGLSNSSVNTIFQDSDHLVWFGTWDGLNRYDSRQMVSFKSDANDSRSISNHVIRAIAEEKPGRLWVATDKGINCYNSFNETFERFFGEQTNKATTKENSFLLAIDANKHVLASFNQRTLYYFNKRNHVFEAIALNEMPAIKKLFFDSNNRLWVLSLDKLLYYIDFDWSDGKAVAQRRVQALPGAIEEVFYNALANEVWFQSATLEFGSLHCADLLLKPQGIRLGKLATAMLFTGTSTLIGTTGGLYESATNAGSPELILANVSVLSFLSGSQGIVWVGTDAKGVLMLTKNDEHFNSVTAQNVPVLASSPVRCFFEEPQGSLWLGTKGSGLVNVREGGAKLETRVFNVSNGLLNNSVYALARHGRTLWVGTDGVGLNYYDLQGQQLHSLAGLYNSGMQSVYAIYPQNDSTLWVGTSGHGLFRLEIGRSKQAYRVRSYQQYQYQNNCPHCLTNNVVYAILPDSDSVLWVGTRGGGLHRLHIPSERFTNYPYVASQSNSLSDDDVLCLYRDPQHVLWVGTNNGLNKLVDYNASSATFVQYTERDGLPNNTIHGMLQDADRTNWVSTNNGLAKMDTLGRVVSYYFTDGLQDNEFSDGSFYRSPYSSLFYFGGIRGYTSFDPSQVLENSYFPKLYLEGFYVNNVRQALANYTVWRKGVPCLELKHADKLLSFIFTPVDYIAGSKCTISYTTAQAADQWIDLGQSRSVVLNNLSAGSYSLAVRWSNANNEWNNQVAYFQLKVLPAWWMSWWAQGLYLILLALLLLLGYKVWRGRIEMRHDLMVTAIEKRQKEEIHQAKLRFFTNIAHEFCNSLTLIYGPTEQLLQLGKTTSKERHYLQTIRANAQRMQHLIQQLMDFRKAETGNLELYIELLDVEELIRYSVDYFTDSVEQKGILLQLDLNVPQAWPCDRDSLEKILFNLLSNALKYTPEHGGISIRAVVVDHWLELVVSNTGSGIKPEDQQHVFNRFTILDRLEHQILKGTEARNGVGLALCKSLVDSLGGNIRVESVLGHETCFILRLAQLQLSPCKELSASTNSVVDQLTDEPADQWTIDRPLILIVDDNKEIQSFLASVLSGKYALLLAGHADEALLFLDTSSPKLMLCDILMPQMDGFELVKRIRKHPVNGSIPIVFLSSERSVASQIEGIEAGADAYLTKPFNPRHLEAVIEQQLNRRQTLKRYFDSPSAEVELLDGKAVSVEDKELIVRLNRIVMDNIDNEKLSLDLLAGEMIWSKSQLYRKIKELQGITPTEFIRQVRLNQAKKMLQKSSKTVQEIMYSCGFNNKAYFYREFSKHYKQTPMEYRKSSSR